VWNLLGNLTAPLFQGGRLRAGFNEQQLAAEQAYWKYREVLHNAILEVEGLLAQEQVLGLQTEHLRQALQHARNSETFYRQRYRQGLVDITDLLNAQQTAFDLDVQVLQVQLNRLSNRIDLGVALGLGV
jgi:outer membrane protein TolC